MLLFWITSLEDRSTLNVHSIMIVYQILESYTQSGISAAENPIDLTNMYILQLYSYINMIK